MFASFPQRSPRRVARPCAWRRLACVVTATLLVACSGGESVSAPPAGTPQLGIASVIVEDPATGDIIFSHNDHWHGFPVVSVGSQRQLRIHFVKQGRAADDHDMPPRNEWFTLQSHADHSLPVVIEDPTRARWSGDRLGGVLAGEAPGASRMSIRVFRGGTTVWEAPPLNLVVR